MIYHFKNYARECDRLRSLINETGFVATFHLRGIPLCFSAELGRRVLCFGLQLLDLGTPRLPICPFLILCMTAIARSLKNLFPPTLPSANGSGNGGVQNVGGTRKEMITIGALFCLQSCHFYSYK